MSLIVVFLLIVLFCLLLVLISVNPKKGEISEFEKKRLDTKESKVSNAEVQRDKYFNAVLGLRFLILSITIFLAVYILITEFHWLTAFALFILGVVGQLFISGIGAVGRLSNGLYGRIENSLFKLFEKYPKVSMVLSRFPQHSHQGVQKIHSRDEVIHILSKNKDVVSAKEIKRIERTLDFAGKTVEDVMTPRSVVEVVQADDLLGPLRLDELHKTGYSRFPVIEEDIDHVIGVVYIRNLLELVDKNSKKAKDLMDTPVHYIKESQTLEHALGAFLRTRHHMFIVVNEYRETIGVITLEDVVEELIGERILDQFDHHDDLRVVASRNPKSNNRAKNSKDV